MNFLLDGEPTERLLFRTIVTSDYKEWLPFHNKPEIACHLQFNAIFKRYEQGLGGMNALICKKTDSSIGLCGILIQEVNQIQELEIGYSILSANWRNDYATEAAQKCKESAFENEWAPQLISTAHVHKVPSKMVAPKLGMNVR